MVRRFTLTEAARVVYPAWDEKAPSLSSYEMALPNVRRFGNNPAAGFLLARTGRSAAQKELPVGAPSKLNCGCRSVPQKIKMGLAIAPFWFGV